MHPERADATIILAQAQEFPFWMAINASLRGWALVLQGQTEEGIEQINQGLRAFRATGAELLRSYFLALLARSTWNHGTASGRTDGARGSADARGHHG